MAETKHTPGPWKVAAHSGQHRSFISSNDESVLPIKNDGIYIAHVLGPDNKANARLIAAAPDLLTALKALLPFTQFAGEMDTTARERAKQDASAAVAKAEGALSSHKGADHG